MQRGSAAFEFSDSQVQREDEEGNRGDDYPDSQVKLQEEDVNKFYWIG